jgi:diguanylate cyclase (GGDEF)-like protein/PAS domain S-box-containing protein
MSVNGAGVVVGCDPGAATAFRQRVADVVGAPAARAFATHGRRAIDWLARALDGTDLAPLELVYSQRDGRVVTGVFTATSVWTDTGPLTLVSVRCRPAAAMTENRLARGELRAIRAIERSSTQATLIIDPDLVVARVVSATLPDTGWEPWRLVGRPILEVVHPDFRDRAAATLARALETSGPSPASTVVIRPADGRDCVARVSLSNELMNPDVRGLVCHAVRTLDPHGPGGLSRDHELTDFLTGVSSRAGRALASRVDDGSEGAQPQILPGFDPREAAAVIVDIVGLDPVNQNFGYDAGDAVIRTIADRLVRLAAHDDHVARLGGGQFIVIRPGGATPLQLKAIARRVLTASAAPVSFQSHRIRVKVKVGAAIEGAEDLPDLIRRAGMSLTMARLSQGDGLEVFGSELIDGIVQRARLLLALRDLDLDHDLRLDYQPIVELRTGTIVGNEALLRWRHPVLGEIPPAIFIPIAETTGAIERIGSWVLRRACEDAASWAAVAGRTPSVSVNVSARELAATTFVGDVVAALRVSRLSPHRLVLEVTETSVLDEPEASSTNLRKLALLGVRVSLDDFGTGYSSLSMLRRLPVHELKIDRSFVDGLGARDQDTAIVASVIELAHTLGTAVVAEGIETIEQLHELLRLGCEHGQGYLLGRPGPVAQQPPWDVAATGRA